VALRATPLEAVAIGSSAAILIGVGYTALLSRPNSADALSYHLPRVLYWVQHRDVGFFPTSYLNLIMMQPVMEYVLLHLYLLSGGDHLSNLVQFAAFVGCIVAVSSVAAEYGLPQRAQVIAALFCSTLPNAILQASGSKNDLVVALWLVCALLFLVRWLNGGLRRDVVFLALSTGLALGTKGTAYLFLGPFLLGGALAIRRRRVPGFSEIAILLAGVLIINGPQYWRNFDLSGSPMGFDSAHGEGAFRWRNKQPGWRATVSNVLRHASEQLGGRSDRWNQAVYASVLALHEQLGIDPQDPATTWRWTEYRPPRNSNHEADANNRWHLLVIVGAIAAACFNRRWLLYAIAPVGGFLAFCYYLKWQPYFSRLEAPLFIVSAPLAAMAIARLRPNVLQWAICLLLVSNARLPVLANWTRPISSLRDTPRHTQYFNDMAQWNNRESYLAAVERVASTSCRYVGIDNYVNHVQYPFQILLLHRQPETRFVHVGVTNASAKYARGASEPCAILCIDCADVPERLRLFNHYPHREQIDKFVLFLR
jgi:hypothetical protein